MRLVLVDRTSDRVCGDTAEFGAGSAMWAENTFRGVSLAHLSLVAARLLDESEGRCDWSYAFADFKPSDAVSGYDVFVVAEDAPEAVPEVFARGLMVAQGPLLSGSQYVGHVRRARPVVPLLGWLGAAPSQDAPSMPQSEEKQKNAVSR